MLADTISHKIQANLEVLKPKKDNIANKTISNSQVHKTYCMYGIFIPSHINIPDLSHENLEIHGMINIIISNNFANPERLKFCVNFSIIVYIFIKIKYYNFLSTISLQISFIKSR